jgi:4a-hydroxytetrahydrobiopterin dehydratase
MSEKQLAKSKCVPCQGGVDPLSGQVVCSLANHISSDWQIIDDHHLEKEFKFKDFQEALDFVNSVGQLAELQGHHPDIYLSWGKVKLTLWTHKINGLHKNDFILAAKVDELLLDK